MMQDWDVIVIGAGTTGLMTAIFASRRGARVLVLEGSDTIGGTLHISSGRMSASGTRFQRENGIEDTNDEFYDDVMRICRNSADPALVRLAVDNSAATFDWLTDHGMPMATKAPVYHAGFHEAYRKQRYAWGVEYGKSILKTVEPHFFAAVASGKVVLKLGHRVESLQQDRDTGRVIGVNARRRDGQVHSFRAANTVIATGGFGASMQMQMEIHGAPLYSVGAWHTSTGDGIRLATSAGGHIRGGEHYHANFGVVLNDYDYPSQTIGRAVTWPEWRQPWEIYVSSAGHRFVREDEPSIDARERELIALPDKRYWIVFDQAIFDAAPCVMEQWSKDQLAEAFGNHPMFVKADTLADLARATGMNPQALAGTVETYNGALGGEDPFGRAHRPAPIATGPFYAIRQHCTLIVSTAGVVTDGELRVTDPSGNPIGGLYAAGEVLGSVATMGDAAANGMLVTPALTFGRLLGERILDWSTNRDMAA